MQRNAGRSCLYTAVAAELLDLRAEMVALRLWHSERPTAQALASDAPFCIDTLEFTEWVQFVFLERMHALIESRAPLPRACDITPMAEEYFRERKIQATSMLRTLQRVDDLLSGRVEARVGNRELSS